MTPFNLQITVNGVTRYNGECTSLVMPLPDGLYGIQANHTPLFAAVSPGVIKYTTPDSEEFFETKGAFLRFENNSAVILARE
ncbi:MAG: F0F1 ATP synthase subunit epsilon [Clostridia bacterium]|nr:F0F1 ATP synthase subunit epsilon [Clostridia bacterium]